MMLAVGVGLAWAFLSCRLRVPVSVFESFRSMMVARGDVVEGRTADHELRQVIVESVTRSVKGWSIDGAAGQLRVSVPINDA